MDIIIEEEMLRYLMLKKVAPKPIRDAMPVAERMDQQWNWKLQFLK